MDRMTICRKLFRFVLFIWKLSLTIDSWTNYCDSYRLENILSTCCYREQSYHNTLISRPIVTPLTMKYVTCPVQYFMICLHWSMWLAQYSTSWYVCNVVWDLPSTVLHDMSTIKYVTCQVQFFMICLQWWMWLTKYSTSWYVYNEVCVLPSTVLHDMSTMKYVTCPVQ